MLLFFLFLTSLPPSLFFLVQAWRMGRKEWRFGLLLHLSLDSDGGRGNVRSVG